MNFNVKALGIGCLGLILTTAILGMSYLSAQTPAASPVPDSSAAGYTPTPTHHHHHKNLMTSNKIANEGIPPGKSIDGENPTITMVPVGTVEAPPASH